MDSEKNKHRKKDAVGWNKPKPIGQPRDGTRKVDFIPHYIPTRYPNGVPDGVPAQLYDADESRETIQMAETVVNLVASKIEP